ncbi:preprotein translocase subunit SecY [Arthrobacter sp. V1I9]|nr:preprotein translocase subunit SecY [Arthrobacter sp. V1I9]
MNFFNRVSAVTGDQVNQAFSDAMAYVAGGIWTIISPYVAAGIILWLLIVGAKAISGRRR